jgi:hypothetical protein
MQHNNTDFELEELRDTLIAKLLAMVIKNRENQSSINKCVDRKMKEYEEIIQELKNKNQQLETDVYNLQEVVHQLIGGLFNPNTQGHVMNQQLNILFSEEYSKLSEKNENSFPTTRQGDENQERIQQLEEKVNSLLQKKKGKKFRNLYSK